ncbi:hypothetical protein HPB52_013103 [Rhipicephalus sanguineus]|uniref:Uncharacterized protein n=1 Tax=Rhipicephalus sanguineus TaxID=34632 RepID=A0A9D4T0P9_RHISA|nr:hypothetical protein HPB52_013103 [Rhipicephalus sanguineus]
MGYQSARYHVEPPDVPLVRARTCGPNFLAAAGSAHLCPGKNIGKNVSGFMTAYGPSLARTVTTRYSSRPQELEENCAVCGLHFHDRFISRYYEHTVNGELVRIDRTRPVLLPGAVATQFPNLPAIAQRGATTGEKAPYKD